MDGHFRYAQNATITGGLRLASRLTPQEEEIIKVSFDSFCEERADGKRILDREKLIKAFQDIGASSDMHDINLLIDDIDENGDNEIDELEWRGIMSRKFLGEEDDSSFGHVFAMLDDNKDGYIPLVEFRKMLMQEGQAPLSEQEVDELLMFADKDSDGLIDYRRFLLWLSNPEVYHKDQLEQQQQKEKDTGLQGGRGRGNLGPSQSTGVAAAGRGQGAPFGPRASGGPAATGASGGSAPAAGGAPAAADGAPAAAAAGTGGPVGPRATASGSGQPGAAPPGAAGAQPAPGAAASSGAAPPASSGGAASSSSAGPPPAGPGAGGAPPAAGRGGPPPGAGRGGDQGRGVGDLGGPGLTPDQRKKMQELQAEMKNMGMPQDDAKLRQALEKTGWDVDQAVNDLMDA